MRKYLSILYTMTKSDRLLRAVKEILFREWDPIGVNECEECRDEDDCYAVSIHHLLRAGADEFKLTAHLGRYQRESMGITGIDVVRDRRVAQQVLALVQNEIIIKSPRTRWLLRNLSS